MSVDPVYHANASATGGRDGRARIDDGSIDVKLAVPKEMGGNGDGNNPEQLFAMGYAACYIGAMRFASSQNDQLARVPNDTSVDAKVGIGPRSEGGFGLKVNLKVSMPGVDPDEARAIIDAGHKICPYSNALRGNVEVTTDLV